MHQLISICTVSATKIFEHISGIFLSQLVSDGKGVVKKTMACLEIAKSFLLLNHIVNTIERTNTGAHITPNQRDALPQAPNAVSTSIRVIAYCITVSAMFISVSLFEMLLHQDPQIWPK